MIWEARHPLWSRLLVAAFTWGSLPLNVGAEPPRATASGAGASVPVAARGPIVKSIQLGVIHSCAILGPDRRVYCWGSASLGGLGLEDDQGPDRCGAVRCSLRPREIRGVGPGVVHLPDPGLANRFRRYLSVREDGTVFSWGRGRSVHGLVGYTTVSDQPSFRGATDVAAGEYPVVDGRLYLSGAGGVDNVRMVTGETSRVFCALTAAGKVLCYGSGEPEDADLLGAGDNPLCGNETPCAVVGVDDAVYVDSTLGARAVLCAVTSRGRVHCWGTAPGLSGTPRLVHGFSDAVRVSVAGTQVCILNTEGEVRCIGLPARASRMAAERFFLAPSRVVPGLPKIREMAVQYNYACARTVDDRILCWGENSRGQLGTGDRKARKQPTEPVAPRPPVPNRLKSGDNTCGQRTRGRQSTPTSEQIRTALAPIWKQIKQGYSLAWPTEPIEYVTFEHTGALIEVRMAPQLYKPGPPDSPGPITGAIYELYEARVAPFCRRRFRIDKPVSTLGLDGP